MLRPRPTVKESLLRVINAGFGWLDHPQSHYEIDVQSFERGYYEADFRVLCEDRDAGESKGYPGIEVNRWNERPEEYDSLDRALQVAERATRLDAANHAAHGALALTHFLRREPERGKIEAYRTIDLNPNNALWLALLGNYLSRQGDFEHSMPMVRKVVALNPHPPPWIRNAIFLDHYVHGRYEAALTEANRMELGDFRNPLFLAAAYGQLDRPDDARRALEELRALWLRPAGDIRRELIERHAFSAALTDHLMEGLAKAGLEGVADPTASGSTLVD